ncbi:MAG: hypothetical protein JXB50_07705 [Spirochaetes bacterium]|nr:hypothetical protein [Spirochaetota bacterium]
MKRKLLLILIIFVLFSCKSADFFILENFNKIEKSKILTDKGIARYENDILNKPEYIDDSINTVKKYFIHALSLDKDNERAKEYIKKIDSVKDYFFNKMMRSVLIYKNKRRKTERDEYYLCYFLEKALDIDPKNSEAVKLKRELKPVYLKLIENYSTDADNIKKRIKTTNSENAKINFYVSIYDFYNRIKNLDNTNKKVLKELNFYSKEFAKITNKKLKENDAKIKAGKYDEVFSALRQIIIYNDRSYVRHNREIIELKYKLFYFWGMDLYNKGKFRSSLYKINEALAIKHDRNLIKVKSIILKKLETENLKSIYENNSAQIDEMIDRGGFDQAKEKIDSLLKIVKNNNDRNDLIEKNKMIIDKCESLYNSAVDDYNNEDFTEAIRKFQIVIKVIPNYKEVKNYLAKSIEKQIVIEMH